MGFVNWLTGFFTAGPEAAEKVLDAGIRGVDALVFTDEEKSVAHQKMIDGWIELQKGLGEETSVRGVTRRILAVLVVVPYVGLNLAAAAVYMFHQAYAKFLFDVANSQFGWMALGVMVFYFGPYMMKQMIPGLNGGGKK